MPVPGGVVLPGMRSLKVCVGCGPPTRPWGVVPAGIGRNVVPKGVCDPAPGSLKLCVTLSMSQGP